MEYLVVKMTMNQSADSGETPDLDPQAVLADGVEMGLTGQLLELEAGTYEIELKTDLRCGPGSREVVLEDSTTLMPEEVVFDVEV